MSFLIVSFAELRPGLQIETLEYMRRSRAVLGQVDGFLSSSLWQDTHNENRYLVMGHYRDDVSARHGIETLDEKGLILQTMEMLLAPPEVYGYHMDSMVGVIPGETWVGEVLSLSRRIAGAGYGEDLRSELQEIFRSLELIEGFRGSAIGTNQALPDQVLGLCFWHDPVAYNASIPAHPLYEVLSFTRTH